jgi:hypothetical protein
MGGAPEVALQAPHGVLDVRAVEEAHVSEAQDPLLPGTDGRGGEQPVLSLEVTLHLLGGDPFGEP